MWPSTIPLGVLIVILFYFPQSERVSVAAQVFSAFHMGKSDAWHGINNMLFSAENTDGCNNASQSFPIPEIAEGI